MVMLNQSKTSISFNITPSIGVLLLFSVICTLNIPILITLWRHSFDDGTYSHAYLIPFISLYLYYKLAGTGQLTYRNELSTTALLLLIISCCLLFITSMAQISIGYWSSLLLVFITSITMLYRFSWYVVFPAAFLVFIFPFWGLLAPILQNMSVLAVTFMMKFTGVPVFVEGQLITIPAGVFEIAGGCSGLRYIIVSIAISSLFVFLYIKDFKRAILFLSVAILGGLLTNWIRITALILIGEYTNMESSLMKDHNTFGWYLYIPFLFLLFAWGNRLADHDLFHVKQNSNGLLEKLTLNKASILILTLMLVFSSTSLKMLAPSVTISNTSVDNTRSPKPNIYYYSSIENRSTANSAASTYQIYQFNGTDLDGKPTFYGNDMIPNGWQLEKQTIAGDWNVAHISQNNNKALILTKYEIDKLIQSQSKEFKITRLQKALNNINKTKLHWIFVPCKVNCDDDSMSLLQL